MGASSIMPLKAFAQGWLPAGLGPDGYWPVSLFTPGGCSHSCHLLWLGWSPPAITGCLWTWSWWTSTTGGIRVASGCSAERPRAACQVRTPLRGVVALISKTGRPLVDPGETPKPLFPHLGFNSHPTARTHSACHLFSSLL